MKVGRGLCSAALSHAIGLVSWMRTRPHSNDTSFSHFEKEKVKESECVAGSELPENHTDPVKVKDM